MILRVLQRASVVSGPGFDLTQTNRDSRWQVHENVRITLARPAPYLAGL